jgi:Domain of unknown function (DUF6134)
MWGGMTLKHALWAATVVLLALLVWPARADDAGGYTFTVLKDGDPVGHHRFVFDRDGDRIEIREATEIEIKLAMIPIYTFEHQARELWQDGRVIQVDATTNDNGEKLDISVRPDGQGYVRTVNGRVDRFDASKRILAVWNKDTLKHHDFFSVVEDQTLKVSFQQIGPEKLTLHGQVLEVDHYRMVGDEERDLWFDSAGQIVKVEFQRHGADITYVRDQLSPLKPEAVCATRC